MSRWTTVALVVCALAMGCARSNPSADGRPCDGQPAGSVRFDAITGAMSYCDGVAWRPLAPERDGGVPDLPPPIADTGRVSDLPPPIADTGATCRAGTAGPGGITLACGSAYQLIVMEPGCAATTNEPHCEGPDEVALAWGASGVLRGDALVGSDSDGPQNTVNLVAFAELEGLGAHPAAEYCASLRLNGFDDWYLPARAEMDLMATEFSALGLSGARYWSSTEDDAFHACLFETLPRATACGPSVTNKNQVQHLRCMRRHGQAMPTPTVSAPPSGAGYFVLSAGTYTGDLGGSRGADTLCLTELVNNWKGKADATARGLLESEKVKAFICSGRNAGDCGQVVRGVRYSFARAAEPTTGGSTFLADDTGTGPGDTETWTGMGHFGGTVEYWAYRGQVRPTEWSRVGSAGPVPASFCDALTSIVGQGRIGRSLGIGEDRWDAASADCSSAKRLICLVHP